MTLGPVLNMYTFNSLIIKHPCTFLRTLTELGGKHIMKISALKLGWGKGYLIAPGKSFSL